MAGRFLCYGVNKYWHWTWQHPILGESFCVLEKYKKEVNCFEYCEGWKTFWRLVSDLWETLVNRFVLPVLTLLMKITADDDGTITVYIDPAWLLFSLSFLALMMRAVEVDITNYTIGGLRYFAQAIVGLLLNENIKRTIMRIAKYLGTSL